MALLLEMLEWTRQSSWWGQKETYYDYYEYPVIIGVMNWVSLLEMRFTHVLLSTQFCHQILVLPLPSLWHLLRIGQKRIFSTPCQFPWPLSLSASVLSAPQWTLPPSVFLAGTCWVTCYCWCWDWKRSTMVNDWTSMFSLLLSWHLHSHTSYLLAGILDNNAQVTQMVLPPLFHFIAFSHNSWLASSHCCRSDWESSKGAQGSGSGMKLSVPIISRREVIGELGT